VSELDEAWALALAEAEARARVAGRTDLAEYLALRNSNDLLRKTGIDWLFQIFTELAGQANRVGSMIQIETVDGHRFRVGTSTMVGRLLTLRSGVRTLMIEAGWPRTPRDGFIRGGGLACASVRHLGITRASRQLLLVKTHTGVPEWKVVEESKSHLDEAAVRAHLEILVDRKT